MRYCTFGMVSQKSHGSTLPNSRIIAFGLKQTWFCCKSAWIASRWKWLSIFWTRKYSPSCTTACDGSGTLKWMSFCSKWVTKKMDCSLSTGLTVLILQQLRFRLHLHTHWHINSGHLLSSFPFLAFLSLNKTFIQQNFRLNRDLPNFVPSLSRIRSKNHETVDFSPVQKLANTNLQLTRHHLSKQKCAGCVVRKWSTAWANAYQQTDRKKTMQQNAPRDTNRNAKNSTQWNDGLGPTTNPNKNEFHTRIPGTLLLQSTMSPRSNTPRFAKEQRLFPSTLLTLEMMCRTECKWSVEEKKLTTERNSRHEETDEKNGLSNTPREWHEDGMTRAYRCVQWLVLSHAVSIHIWLCVRVHEKNDVWSVSVYTLRRLQWIAIDCRRNQLWQKKINQNSFELTSNSIQTCPTMMCWQKDVMSCTVLEK